MYFQGYPAQILLLPPVLRHMGMAHVLQKISRQNFWFLFFQPIYEMGIAHVFLKISCISFF